MTHECPLCGNEGKRDLFEQRFEVYNCWTNDCRVDRFDPEQKCGLLARLFG